VVCHPAFAPVPKKYVEEGIDFNGRKIAFGEMPIGNGPFKMAEPWRRERYIKVVRNENYRYGEAAYLDGVDFMIFRDPDTAYTEFLAGSLDFAQIGEGKISEAVSQFGEAPNGYTANPNEQVLLGLQTGIYYLVMNNEAEFMKDPLIRKAISLAINRQAICSIIFEDTRDPADNFLSPDINGYVKDGWADSHYDIEGAKAALAEAGYPNGQGIPRLKLSLNTGGGHERIMELIQADLAKIGIETELDSMEWSTYLQAVSQGNYTFGRLGWAADFPIAYNFLFPIFSSRSGNNYSKYRNPEVDAAMSKAKAILDNDERATAMAGVNKLISEDNPVVPVMFYKHNYVTSSRINDFNLGPLKLANYTKVWISGGGK
jgi:peptide/nickel transport system substrate-binding protein/oligopeptide transport system substrate-binding protein